MWMEKWITRRDAWSLGRNSRHESGRSGISRVASYSWSNGGVSNLGLSPGHRNSRELSDSPGELAGAGGNNAASAIFDMDGVIIASHPIHKKAWRKFLKLLGKVITEENITL